VGVFGRQVLVQPRHAVVGVLEDHSALRGSSARPDLDRFGEQPLPHGPRPPAHGGRVRRHGERHDGMLERREPLLCLSRVGVEGVRTEADALLDDHASMPLADTAVGERGERDRERPDQSLRLLELASDDTLRFPQRCSDFRHECTMREFGSSSAVERCVRVPAFPATESRGLDRTRSSIEVRFSSAEFREQSHLHGGLPGCGGVTRHERVEQLVARRVAQPVGVHGASEARGCSGRSRAAAVRRRDGPSGAVDDGCYSTAV
jgi:hypothetical protein